MFYAVVSFESLEERRFLSAAMIAGVQPMSAAAHADVVQASAIDVTGTYSGILKLRRPDEVGRTSYVVTLEITSQDAAGNIAGMLSGPVFGNTTFAGGEVGAVRKGGVPLTFNFTGDRAGLLKAKLDVRGSDRLNGTISDASGSKLGTFRLNRMADITTTTAPATGNGADAGTPTPTNSGAATPGAPTVSTRVAGSTSRRVPGTNTLPTTSVTGVSSTSSTSPSTTTNNSTTAVLNTTTGNNNVVVNQTPLLGPGSVNPIPPDGSVNVTSGSPDISVAGGGGVGSGIDISNPGGGPTGSLVNNPNGSVNVSMGTFDISSPAGGGVGSGLDISSANGSVSGPSISSASSIIDTSSSGTVTAVNTNTGFFSTSPITGTTNGSGLTILTT